MIKIRTKRVIALQTKLGFRWAVIILSALLVLTIANLWRQMAKPAVAEAPVILKWVDFSIPSKALEKAMKLDIAAHNEEREHPIDWIELLAVLGTKYGGNWRLYKAADMDGAAELLAAGETYETILTGYKNYDYFYTAYSAVLGGFLGEFQKEVPDKENPGQINVQARYGLKAYHPIAEGFGYSHYEDFGNSRSYGYNRRHMGNDLCGSIGTPIVAMEGGVIEELGWNQYGGWRIGIRSFDNKRYYYYAHLRKDHPYAPGLKIGSHVQGGDVIGYLGMTGYSTKENVNNMKVPHLHFGIQLVFDESQKDGVTQIWIDVYDLVELLETNRATVLRVEKTKDYERKYHMYDSNFPYGE